jgi:hypothetical protein
MKRVLLIFTGLFAFVTTSYAAGHFQVKINGELSVMQKSSGQSLVMKDTGTLGIEDSIYMQADNQAEITIESGTRLLVKGPLSACLAGDSSSVVFILNEGQMMLDRGQAGLIPVTITSKDYSFMPVGTVAAVKTAQNGNPSTAVIKGKVQMLSPSGESIMVEEGQFGSVGEDGKLFFGKLPQKAIESLQTWAGIQPSAASEQGSSNNPASNIIQTSATVQETTQPQKPVETKPQNENPANQVQTSSSQQSKSEAVKDVKEEKAATAEKGDKEQKAVTAEQENKSGSENASAGSSPSPRWEMGAQVVTVDNEQWTRLSLGVDVPIWKFGIFFDVGLFIDNQGKFSDKEWNFKDDWVDALTSKIRYIRFGQETDPLFIKVGGLDNVTMGYGFLVDRFTNMLHYPDQRLLGLQFNLNNISPAGITLQTMLADFKDFRDDGGLMAARLAITPLKMTNIPIVKGMSIGGTYAVDLNQYAPARKWDIRMPGTYGTYKYLRSQNMDSSAIMDSVILRMDSTAHPFQDYAKYQKEVDASKGIDQFGMIGVDVGVPLISTSLLSLDLYGQAGIRDDGLHGWGIGAPGLALKVWRLWANVEYRRVVGRFTPGYFGPYYFDERLVRDPEVATKESNIPDDTLNGVFGRLGFNIADVLSLEGGYQYMVGKDSKNKDQRFEASCSVGDLVLKKIPKINKAEVYYYKTEIGNFGYNKDGKIEHDSFFDKSPYMYFGYRAGFEIYKGASLIWDSRYGFKQDANGKLVSNNNIIIQTVISF